MLIPMNSAYTALMTESVSTFLLHLSGVNPRLYQDVLQSEAFWNAVVMSLWTQDDDIYPLACQEELSDEQLRVVLKGED